MPEKTVSKMSPDEVARYLLAVAQSKQISCIIRDADLGKGDYAQLDNDAVSLSGDLPVLSKFRAPGLYFWIISDPVWYQIPEGCIDHKHNQIIWGDMPDWKTCLERGACRIAIAKIVGIGTPPRNGR